MTVEKDITKRGLNLEDILTKVDELETEIKNEEYLYADIYAEVEHVGGGYNKISIDHVYVGDVSKEINTVREFFNKYPAGRIFRMSTDLYFSEMW